MGYEWAGCCETAVLPRVCSLEVKAYTHASAVGVRKLDAPVLD
jgi:hypothetical protein